MVWCILTTWALAGRTERETGEVRTGNEVRHVSIVRQNDDKKCRGMTPGARWTNPVWHVGQAFIGNKFQDSAVGVPASSPVLHLEHHWVLNLQGCCMGRQCLSTICGLLMAGLMLEPLYIPRRSKAEGGKNILSPFSASSLSMKDTG